MAIFIERRNRIPANCLKADGVLKKK